ncbi:hypothetical protein AHMF7605_05510 [Adhaeribacter arboris]|uniref:Regulator of microtubule dynamics protein 1 n=1 Tax=Adhaeribacter arboris TaxID=2072846 RepID=A0A2T2YBX6_9BACT|nr:tetratricopeptide repeat protein [Adhaeribacter arboris]PSR53022.1 hypothetical protein AHMF7605_05510 [Adhaeribacter arboris]
MIKVWNKSIGVWLVLLCICFRAFSNNTSDELVREANQLLGEYKDAEALQKFEEVLVVNPEHYEALYKISLLHSRIGLRYADELQKGEHFILAKDFAEKALKIKKQGAESNYVMALAIANLSFVSGTKARISNLKEIKSHLDKALAANPNYASAWQLLGRWHYKVANMNVFECTISKLVKGCTKSEASNLQAVNCFQKAIKLDGKNLNYYYDLAIVYREMKEIDQSIAILQNALQVQPVTSDDLELSRRCKVMLNDLSPS